LIALDLNEEFLGEGNNAITGKIVKIACNSIIYEFHQSKEQKEKEKYLLQAKKLNLVLDFCIEVNNSFRYTSSEAYLKNNIRLFNKNAVKPTEIMDLFIIMHSKFDILKKAVEI